MQKLIVISATLIAIISLNCSSTKDTAIVRDGLSMEKAVKVKSVGEEYEFARKNCSDCAMKSQALLSEGKKYYDRLTLIRPSGEEVNFYFDISSFYGKW